MRGLFMFIWRREYVKGRRRDAVKTVEGSRVDGAVRRSYDVPEMALPRASRDVAGTSQGSRDVAGTSHGRRRDVAGRRTASSLRGPCAGLTPPMTQALCSLLVGLEDVGICHGLKTTIKSLGLVISLVPTTESSAELCLGTAPCAVPMTSLT